MKFLRVNKKRKCPVCGHADWCGVSEDGNAVACMRVASERQARNGSNLHFFGDDSQPKAAAQKSAPAPAQIVPEYATRSAAEISEVYTAFLDHLDLENRHQIDLENRGLGFISILVHGYKSMPLPGHSAQICSQLSNNFDLAGVPGFYRRGGSWRFVDYKLATGYLIPIRNRQSQICALSLRRSDNQKPKYQLISSGWLSDGAPSGVPPHFATLGKPIKRELISEIIITEGALKANISSEYCEMPIVGLVSVTTFNETLPETLKEAFPNLETVKIAFDMDAISNAAVKNQRDRLGRLLHEANLDARILTWDAKFKGFDDYLTRKTAQAKMAA